MVNKRKIYFRADASAEIGYGHFTRTLALADMLKDDFDCKFFTCHPTEYQKQEAAKVCDLVSLGETTHYDDFLKELSGDEIVVLDNYFFGTDYQKKIKLTGCKLVCVDDMHDKHYVADVVINHALTDPKLFDVESYTKLCLGFEWALLRKPFLYHTESKERGVGNWLIAFGGTDYYNLSEKYLKLIENREDVKHIFIVVGDAYRFLDTLKSENCNVSVKKDLSANEMSLLMQSCEYAIVPCSGICIEALSQGCKILAGYFVDNQTEIYKEYSSNNYITPLGNLTKCEELPTAICTTTHNSLFANIIEQYRNLFTSI